MDVTRPSLLLRIRDANDQDAWQSFYGIYRPLLVRYGRATGLCADDADDLAQQVMSVVHQKIDAFEYDPKSGRFRGWLHTLVRNRSSNLKRGRGVANRAQEKVAAQERRREEDQVTPDQIFNQLWMQEHLWHCLKQLELEVEATTFQVFRQVVFEEQSAAKVADELGVTVQNVHTIKWRLTKRVGELMKDLVGEELD
ncbi:MAG: sigma-70 family RNA polymerase sigma factor [Planctomycetes bacterium]|nr:sigma-70 family RNA polymerase sigma factor [Planctomycetota bacterium]